MPSIKNFETKEAQKYKIEQLFEAFHDNLLKIGLVVDTYSDLTPDMKCQVLDTLMQLFTNSKAKVFATNGFLPAIKPQYSILVTALTKMSLVLQDNVKDVIVNQINRTEYMIDIYNDMLKEAELVQPQSIHMDKLTRYLMQLEGYRKDLLKKLRE
jgi:hypothetical protein